MHQSQEKKFPPAWILPFANGFLDLRENVFHEGEHTYYASPITWRGYDQPCPTWEQFVRDAAGEQTEFLQRVLGYGISGSTREHIFVVICGTGRSGKTLLFRVISDVLGKSLAMSASSALICVQKYSRNNDFEMAQLEGKRFVFVSDIYDCLDHTRINFLTGGDTLICRKIGSREYTTFEPNHLLCAQSNEEILPPDDNFSFSERLLNIKLAGHSPLFDGSTDENIRAKFQGELSGIAAWLVRGCLEYQKSGLKAQEHRRRR